MKKLSMIVMAAYGLTATAQGVDQSRNFIYLNSDSVIYASRITLRPDLTGMPQLRADSRRIPTERVKFFNNEDGFFANTRRLTFRTETAFAERTIEGRINLFQPAMYHPDRPYGTYDYGYGRRYRYRESWSRGPATRLYYNKGFEDLKTLNYKNLQHDMADNAESMNLLEGYRKSINTSTVLYTAAGVSIVAALVSFVVTGQKDMDTEIHPPGWWPGSQHQSASPKMNSGPNFTASFALLGAGLGFAVGGFSVRLSAARKLENAFDAYNR